MLSVQLRARQTTGFLLEASFVAQPGITILFGASGSGKTTLLRCLAGLLQPDAGQIVVDGRVLFDADTRVHVPPQRRRVGYVFQQLALFPHLSVAANIAYGLTDLAPTERTARVDQAAGAFRIAHLLGRRPDAISGGERQRVALARTLVTRPDILLLDEPLSALDYATKSMILKDLQAWTAARRIPIVYVTHSHREAVALGQRVLVMHQGRIVADGTPTEVLDMPGQETTARLAGFENVFDATVTALHREAGTMECRLDRSTTDIEVPWGPFATGELTRLAVRAGDILLATVRPQGLSARNLLPGTIRALRQEGPTVVATVDAGPLFEVHVTPGARTSLGLHIGQSLWLVIKTHSCRLVKPDAGQDPYP